MPDWEALEDFYPSDLESSFAEDLSNRMQSAYISGGREAIEQMKEAEILQGFNEVNEEALAFYNSWSLQLSTKETQRALNRIKGRIFRGLKEGEDTAKIAREIKPRLLPYRTDVPETAEGVDKKLRYRSEMIARTEVSRANNMGRLEAYKQQGVDKVRWLCGPNPCSLCADKEGRVYKRTEVPAIPQHPHCVCSYAPVVKKNE